MNACFAAAMEKKYCKRKTDKEATPPVEDSVWTGNYDHKNTAIMNIHRFEI